MAKASRDLTQFILHDIFIKYDLTAEDTITIANAVVLSLMLSKDGWEKIGHGMSGLSR